MKDTSRNFNYSTKIFLFLAISLIFQKLITAQHLYPTSIPYLEIKNYKSEKASFGQIALEAKKGIKKQVNFDLKIPEADTVALSKIIKDLQVSPQVYSDDTLDILIYIHCMWGGVDFFETKVLMELQPYILPKEGRIDQVFPIIWHSGTAYRKNIGKAQIIGEKLGETIWYIIENIEAGNNGKPVRFHLLMHSMGHQVFRGIMRKRDLEEIRIPIFEEIIFAAPDLNNLEFDKGNDFEYLPQIAERITYFINENDRFLAGSQWVTKTKRLGLAGLPEETKKGFTNIEEINVTELEDVKGFMKKINGHTYFIASEMVMEMIKKIYN